MRLVAVGLGILSIVLCAWFALGIRQAHDTNQAQAILANASALSARQAARVDSLLHTAGILNPDQAVNLLRGEVATLASHTAQAGRIFQAVADREPLNIDAWLLVAHADFGQGAPLRNALSHIAELNHEFKAPG